MASYKIIYDFLFPDKTTKTYTVEIDKENLTLVNPPTKLPAWTELENKKCAHCPLKKEDYPHCPVAASIAHIVETFQDKVSFTEVAVKVSTSERVYVKQGPLQNAMFSIFGLLMASSACPYMDFLKPMARYHLPFSTSEETIVRSISMYLLRQYFVAKRGGEPDMTLAKLENHYSDLQKVNMGVIGRIRGMNSGDADVNAITILQSIASLLTMAISKDLSKIEPLFKS